MASLEAEALGQGTVRPPVGRCPGVPGPLLRSHVERDHGFVAGERNLDAASLVVGSRRCCEPPAERLSPASAKNKNGRVDTLPPLFMAPRSLPVTNHEACPALAAQSLERRSDCWAVARAGAVVVLEGAAGRGRVRDKGGARERGGGLACGGDAGAREAGGAVERRAALGE